MMKPKCNFLRTSVIKLHKNEKLSILASNILANTVVFLIALVNWFTSEELLAKFGCVILFGISILYPIITLRTLQGKGIFKEENTLLLRESENP